MWTMSKLEFNLWLFPNEPQINYPVTGWFLYQLQIILNYSSVQKLGFSPTKRKFNFKPRDFHRLNGVLFQISINLVKRVTNRVIDSLSCVTSFMWKNFWSLENSGGQINVSKSNNCFTKQKDVCRHYFWPFDHEAETFYLGNHLMTHVFSFLILHFGLRGLHFFWCFGLRTVLQNIEFLFTGCFITVGFF